MADIDVVPKQGTKVWLWIIVAIVLAVILFALMGAFSGDEANRIGELINAPSTGPHVGMFVTT
jgi:uncharacterized protein YggT (Ycf19 family)